MAGENVYGFGPNAWTWCDPLGLCKETPKQPKTTRLWRAVEPEELQDIYKYGDYNIHPNSTFKRFAFNETDVDTFIKANPGRTYTKTYIDIPTDKLKLMYEHPDPGGVGKAIGIDVYDAPEFYKWFDKVVIP